MRRHWKFCVLIAVALAGCRSRSDLIEAELRLRDRQLRETREDLDRASSLNEAFEASLRNQRCANPAQQACAHPVIRQIQVGRGTSGIDEGHCQGDEGVQVVIVPTDAEGSAVKVGGTARVMAYQFTPEGLRIPLSCWEVSAAHLQRNWRTGLLSTGYVVALPWQVQPTFARLRIVVTFTTIDGAVFEGERDLTIRLGPLGGQRESAGSQLGTPQSVTPQPTLPSPIVPPPGVPIPEVPPALPGSVLPPPVPAGPNTSWKPARL